MVSEKNNLTYLVVGCGSIGRRHISNLLSLGRRVHAFDANQEVISQTSDTFPSVVFHSTYSEALELNPDIVIVCTPNHTHVDIAITAAKKGCHLFVEKPVSHNLDKLAELEREIIKNKLITLVGCNMRFQHGIERLYHWSSRIGRIYSIRCQFGQYLPDWRSDKDYKKTYSARSEMGGGIVLDAIHEIDYLLWLMRKKPVKVSAITSNSGLLDIDVEDNAGIHIEFSDGAIGEIHIDYLSRIYRRTCEIGGEHGVLYWDEMDKTIKIFEYGANKNWKIEKEPDNYDFNESYIKEIVYLEQCIKAGKEPMSPVSEGKFVLEVALAAKKSAYEGSHVNLKK